MMQYTKNKNIHLVTGANLLLIIQLLMIQTEDEIYSHISKIIDEAKQGVCYLNQVAEEKEEDF